MKIKKHKARKDHQCYLCGKKIPKGDQYIRKTHDDLYVEKEHTNCELYSHRVTAHGEPDFSIMQ